METIKTIFFEIVNYIDVIVKVTGWLLFVISIIVIFAMIIRTYRIIYMFLKPMGISRRKAFRVSIICRKDWTQNIRKFIEYCILTSHVRRLNSSQWEQKIEEFIALYIKNPIEEDCVEIPNTFCLREELILERINDYFELISRRDIQKMFAINTKEGLSFLLKIRIKEGYFAPLVQISSLQERFKSDWSQILNHYVTSFSSEEKKYPSEVSSFYTWLMWGPSVCALNEGANFQLGMYGMGDESMAIPTVFTDKSYLLWDEIRNNLSKNKLGTYGTGKFTLCHQVDYLKKKYNNFSRDVIQFINATIEEDSFGILLEEQGESTISAYMKERDCIFSAYIWIMLYYTTEDGKYGFDCTRSTVWFEHANIADEKNVKLLTETLVNKCISYFETIWDAPEYKDRRYSIPWAINDSVRSALIDRIRALQTDNTYKYSKDFMDRVDLDVPDIEQESILGSIDMEFDNSGLVIQYKNIDFNNKNDLGLLGRFYCELYISEFPDDNERETLDNIIKQAQRLNKHGAYHCIIAVRGDEIVGGIIGDYFASCNCGAVEFLVVSASKRKQRIGTDLLSNLIDFMNMDAMRFNNKSSMEYCYFEVENPDKILEKQYIDNCWIRLNFWKKMSARILDMTYIQPPLDDGKKAVDYLYLGTIPIQNDADVDRIDKKAVLAFISEYFKLAIGIDDVENCEEYKCIRDSILDDKVEMYGVNELSESNEVLDKRL